MCMCRIPSKPRSLKQSYIKSSNHTDKQEETKCSGGMKLLTQALPTHPVMPMQYVEAGSCVSSLFLRFLVVRSSEARPPPNHLGLDFYIYICISGVAGGGGGAKGASAPPFFSNILVVP